MCLGIGRKRYGEGEMKFYIDGDKDYPTICGTGTEDYFGGAWSFATQQNGQTVENQYCTPYLGYPYYSSHDTFLHNDYHNDDQMPQRSFYRWHLLDPILFEKDLKLTLQQIGASHGGLFERQDDVATTCISKPTTNSRSKYFADCKDRHDQNTGANDPVCHFPSSLAS